MAVLIALGVVAAGVAVVAAGPGALPSGPGLLAVAAVVVVAAAAWRWGVPARLRARWAGLRFQPLPARSLGAAAVGMLLSWLADLSVLALAFVALGEQPPWTGLVLAYCLGQAASALPFTPGGLAVVEGGLTARSWRSAAARRAR